MTTNPSIQELTFTVDVDMQSIRDQVGPLVLSTAKPYRAMRHKQSWTVARRINMGQREQNPDNRNMGALRNVPIEIFCMIFERMDVQTFVAMKGVCKSVKMIVESSRAHKLLGYISTAEPKSLSLFVRSGLGSFYPFSVLGVFFEKECSFCHGYGDCIFLPTMTRICLYCSDNYKEASCICMTTAMEKYSLTGVQITEACIPLITNAIPHGNLKLLPEYMVRKHALRIYGSIARIQFEFERNKRVKMEKYEIQYLKWKSESKNFDDWIKLAEMSWGTHHRSWPGHIERHYSMEKERLKKKPKLPRQTFEVIDTHTTGREATTRRYLTRKAKVIDRYTGVSERFQYCLGCRGNVLPAQYLAIGAGGSDADVWAAQRPYLSSHGDLSEHLDTCTQVAAMRYEYQQKLVVAVQEATEHDQRMAISMAIGS